MSGMNASVERSGTVIGSAHGMTRICLESAPTCSGCGSRGTCKSGAAKEQIVEVRLPALAQPGAQVTLTLPESSVVLAALLGYLLPVVGLLLGAVIASGLFAGDLSAVLGAAGGFLAGLLGVRLISGGVMGKALAPHVCPSQLSHFTGEKP